MRDKNIYWNDSGKYFRECRNGYGLANGKNDRRSEL